MGFQIGREPGWVMTAREKAMKLDDKLSRKISPQAMREWRLHDRGKFIEFAEKTPVHEWRVMKNVPKNGKQVICGEITDAFVVEYDRYRTQLYVIVKKAEG